MSRRYRHYRNELELSDGRTLEVYYSEEQGIADRGDVDASTSFRIDGVPCNESELPAEVTAEVIAQLVDASVECST